MVLNPLRNRAYHLLRRSEGFFKTDMVYLAKGGFWLTTGHVIQTILGLILLVAFANLIPKEVYGTYQFIISTVAIISTFTLTGMGTAIARAVAKGSEGSLRYGLRIQLLWSIGIVVISGMLAGYYFLNGNLQIAYALLIAGVLQPFIIGFSLYKPYLTGKQLFRESATLGIFQKALPFLAILPTLYLTNNALIIVSVYFTSHAISLFTLYTTVVKRHKLSNTSDAELSSYSKHLSLMGGLTKIAEHLDKVLIWHFLGAAPVAIYTIAQLPIYHMQSVFQLVHALSFSKIAQQEFSTLKNTLLPKIRSYFFVVLVAVIIYIVAAPLIFRIFFPDYLESIVYTQFMALILLTVPRNLLQQTFAAHKMKAELYKVNISFPIVRVILLLILTPHLGLWGVVIALLGTELYNSILQGYLFNQADS